MPAKIPALSREQLEKLYYEDLMTQGEIADLYGCSDSLVSNWMKEYGIATRDVKAAQRAITLDRETLYSLYVDQNLSSTDIADLYDGLDDNRVLLLLERAGIPRRPNTWKVGGWNKGQPLSKKQRKRLSEAAKKRIGKKSPRYGAVLSKKTRQKISDSLKGRFRGPDNPQWIADKKYQRWRETWHARYEYREWRSFVFTRDDYTCQLCGSPSNGNIEAHHIKPVEDCPNLLLDIDNGITLCIACHRKIKGKEAEYEQQFLDILNRSIQ